MLITRTDQSPAPTGGGARSSRVAAALAVVVASVGLLAMASPAHAADDPSGRSEMSAHLSEGSESLTPGAGTDAAVKPAQQIVLTGGDEVPALLLPAVQSAREASRRSPS